MESRAPAAEVIAAYRQRYLANLAGLYAADPELAAQIEAVPFAQLPPLESTRDGNATLRLEADDGKPIYTHSRYRPLEEAAALVASQSRRPTGGQQDDAEPENGAEQGATTDDEADDDLANSAFFVNGLGLGYHVAELERRFNDPLLIVAEDDLAVLKAALCVADLAAPLRANRLTLLTTGNKADLHQKLRSAAAHLMLGLRFIDLPHTARRHVAFYRQTRALMRDFIAFCQVQICSLLLHARITCENVAHNLPAYVGQPGVEVLANRAAGYPAILVAAGPSLARNIDQLASLRDRAVIIAVQTVMKTLLARGMPPHFVTTLDFHEISAQFFHGIEDFGQTILVAEPKAAWRVLDNYRGRTHVLHSPFADELLRDAAPPRAPLRAGSTVAHLCFYLAEHLGCDPIILVGQDLSFTEGLYYPPGMQIEQIWQPELGRFQTIEMKQWERIVRSRTGLRIVQDIHGRDTYTDEQLYTYAEQFMSDFSASKSHIIHATEGGMRLAGTEVMSLREAGERYCTRPLPPDLFKLPPAPPADQLKPPAVAALEQRLAELKTIRNIAAETVQLLDKLRDAVERPAEFNRLVARVDELRARMRQNDRTYHLVVQVSQLAELRRIQADRAIRDEDTETAASARRRLKRDREYVCALIDGCEYLERMLPRALDRLRERL